MSVSPLAAKFALAAILVVVALYFAVIPVSGMAKSVLTSAYTVMIESVPASTESTEARREARVKTMIARKASIDELNEELDEAAKAAWKAAGEKVY